MAEQNTFQFMLLNGWRTLGNKNRNVYVWPSVKSMSQMLVDNGLALGLKNVNFVMESPT